MFFTFDLLPRKSENLRKKDSKNHDSIYNNKCAQSKIPSPPHLNFFLMRNFVKYFVQSPRNARQ